MNHFWIELNDDGDRLEATRVTLVELTNSQVSHAERVYAGLLTHVDRVERSPQRLV